jgi:hypothetical protein
MIVKSNSNKILNLLFFFALIGCSTGYVVDSEKVYFTEWNEAQGKVKRDIGADASTFQVLEIENYAIDKNHAYFQGNIIGFADPKTFKPLSELIAKDKSHGYNGSIMINKSDGPTFELIEGNYTRDKNDVYYIDQPLSSKSPKGFEILKAGHGNWARDGITYYYSEKKLPVADYKTFKILDDDCFFAKDKFQVYNQDRVLDGVDAETFKFIENCVGKDKFGCHNGTERCTCPKNAK